MIPLLFGTLAPILGTIVDRLIPDKAEAQRQKLEIEARLTEAANQVLLQQAEINKVEAGSNSIFVAGWRPFIGWICGAALGWTFLGHDLVTWIVVLAARPDLVPPAADTGPLFELVLAMLGLGGLRTFEKLRGVAR